MEYFDYLTNVFKDLSKLYFYFFIIRPLISNISLNFKFE